MSNLSLNSFSDEEVSISSDMSCWISLQLFPISMAVSYLSPVNTHTLMLVSINFAIVSGTPY
jgi:hypothetical protein